ncbi:Retrovirus-related Pol polyprotein from transposon RE1 [Vitis vinifera]|uniref:Retrovirus-related Pol polyprotein from transposon RE1 n=1 Tax=Vitis vinifera TaxID=29760 RepID=A0A438DGL0_VITVI|nr:Retrovirus-related Pol polyprotein from transposon RE1 [Vitis vinifera]
MYVFLQLEYDVLEYVVIERLAQGGRDKLKDDGLNLSDWLQSLASFWGHLLQISLTISRMTGTEMLWRLQILEISWLGRTDYAQCLLFACHLGQAAAIIHSGQISLAISQSDHLSLSSLIPVISPYSQSQGRKRFPVGRIVVRKHSRRQLFPRIFRRTFRRRFFSTPQGAPGGDLQFVPKHRNQKPIHAPSSAFFRPAREPLSGDALPPPGSPDADQPPFLPVLPSEPCTCLFWGSFASAGPRSVFPASSGYFFSTPIPARALGSVLLPFRSMTKYGMASSQVSSVTSPESGGRSEIPNLGGNDSSPILITGHKLNGHNYLQWSQSVLLFICGKGKDEYLTGEAVMPETTEPGFRKWKIENSMIMSWLINSMNNDIGENFLLFGTAKDIWDAAKETYSSSENTSELFRLNQLHDFRQGEQSVTQYYNTLTRYWQQLDLFETHSWKCSDDAATYRQIVEQKRLFKFFLGLNRELDDVRGRIMGIKPLQVSGRLFQSSGGDRQKRDRPWCDYCKKPGHYKETCWKLHGKPADWKPKPRSDRDGRAHGQYYRDSPHASRGGMKPWIVDTGASDHMTGDAAILQNYKPSNGHSSVHIADGSKSKIAGTGLESGKMIGSAELCSGLYLLSCGQFSNQVSQASCVQSQSMLESFNSVSNSKGESMNEHQVWESRLEGVPSFTQSHQILPNSRPLSCPHPCRHQSSQPNTQMRRKRQELEHGSQSTCGQYIDSNSSLPEENIGEDRAGEVLIPSIDDSTLPIALRKGVRRCSNTIQEALKISEWKKAIQDEIDALEKNETWTITDLPVGKRPVGCKWIFTIKYKADGSVERFKARLVARGFTQSYGIDYQETFAPVAKLNTIRILLSLAVNQDWCLQQLDIKNAFLNGDLEEEVYMEYHLVSKKVWQRIRFTKAVLKLGYKQGQTDHTLFVKKSHAGKMAILIVYVDDIILSGNDMEELQNLKKYLSEEFEVKDLGNLKYFLGMEVARSRKGIVVSQRKYILDLLKETGMLGCKPIDTPMDSQKKLGIEKESTPVDRGRYQRLVGRLIYLSHTRPDIGFAVSAVSQFMHSPTEEHMEAVYRILRYLKMTPGKGLFFRKTENRDTEVYSDADWAGNIIDRRSTSGYCFFVWGNLVTWRSKKQSVVARSSAEAEYRALAQGICEGIWIKRVLSELGQTSSSPILMMCDNQATISIAKNPVHHDRTKHVEIDRHFITEKVTNETVKLNYVPTKHQTADILTKALPRPNFEDLTCKLGLYDIYSPA